MVCSNCGKETTSPILYKGLQLCSRCHDRTKLPLYQLTKLWRSHTLYDPASGRYFPNAEESLKACGFMLYRKYQFMNQLANPSYREIRIYRYFGNVACPLVNYQWPSSVIRCRNLNCPQY